MDKETREKWAREAAEKYDKKQREQEKKAKEEKDREEAYKVLARQQEKAEQDHQLNLKLEHARKCQEEQTRNDELTRAITKDNKKHGGNCIDDDFTVNDQDGEDFTYQLYPAHHTSVLEDAIDHGSELMGVIPEPQ